MRFRMTTPKTFAEAGDTVIPEPCQQTGICEHSKVAGMVVKSIDRVFKRCGVRPGLYLRHVEPLVSYPSRSTHSRRPSRIQLSHRDLANETGS